MAVPIVPRDYGLRGPLVRTVISSDAMLLVAVGAGGHVGQPIRAELPRRTASRKNVLVRLIRWQTVAGA